MTDIKKSDIIRPPIFIHHGVKAFFTTNSLNCNLNSISKLLNIQKNKIYLPAQKHTDKIHVLESDLKKTVADAVLTREKGILIGVKVADCVPVLLYDKQKSAIGAVHAGWRGTAKQILKNTIKTMRESFNSSTGDILIAIGPSIRGCCYKVGVDVKNAVKAAGTGKFCFKKDGKCFIDLSSENIEQALSAGISKHNIWQSEECTHCNPEKFHSYRHSKTLVGKQGGFIGLW